MQAADKAGLFGKTPRQTDNSPQRAGFLQGDLLDVGSGLSDTIAAEQTGTG
jgi:hypothetical protein